MFTLTCALLQFWQLYNSITLFKMFQLPECKEWQVKTQESPLLNATGETETLFNYLLLNNFCRKHLQPVYIQISPFFSPFLTKHFLFYVSWDSWSFYSFVKCQIKERITFFLLQTQKVPSMSSVPCIVWLGSNVLVSLQNFVSFLLRDLEEPSQAGGSSWS